MTNAEFSDTFTTLLNSYNTQARFGEQASKNDIVLDEYEKSVLLTQAQDIIIKSYFDGTLNSQGQGFDDSTRRQMDFSSLIKIASLAPTNAATSVAFDERGIVYQLPRKKIATANKKEDAPTGTYEAVTGESGMWYVKDTTDVLFILNEKLTVRSGTSLPAHWSKVGHIDVEGTHTNEVAAILPHGTGSAYATVAAAEADGWKWTDTKLSKERQYVIVPINYKEYDREMSKPYAQPLKKQAWRLFQNQATGFDINTELIPKFNIVSEAANYIYKIRYVKRPRPIILETLPNELEIDGENQKSECELNPIIHMDILNKAVELAITTRGGAAPERGQYPANNMKGQNN